MREMKRQLWRPGNMLYPVPAAMVSVAGEEGKSNIITIAWAGTICSDPPMVSISVRPERYSYELLKQRGEFVVNLTTRSLAWATDYCGVRSGRDVDKWKETAQIRPRLEYSGIFRAVLSSVYAICFLIVDRNMVRLNSVFYVLCEH